MIIVNPFVGAEMTRILLADDDPDVTSLLVMFLQPEHEVDVANDGSEAYEKLTSGSYAIAILDWDMPEMTGPEVCQKYRSIGGQAAIIMLTGRSSEDDKEIGFDFGADDYLTKPFSFKELAGRIKALIRRSGGAGRTASASTTMVDMRRFRVCVSCSTEYDASDPKSEFCPNDGAATVLVSVEHLLGQTVCGNYKIDSLLGVGAWSEVYKATNLANAQTVAIKILHTHLSSDPLKVARFNREADALLRLQHRCLARVHGQSALPDGRPCLIMEFLEGMSLDSFLSTYGRMTLSQAKHFFTLLCDGLACAHEQGLIHRDLKPSNVYIVNENGIVIPKILDFGMAKILTADGTSAMASLTQSGEVMGTPAYMSPEQCIGNVIDARSDLYSLGCLVYESLSGTRAIPGKTAFEAMSNQLARYPDSINDVCPEANIDAKVENAIFRLLAKDPSDRFASAREFAEIFQAVC
jgi:CheY-like chemotaxis protein